MTDTILLGKKVALLEEYSRVLENKKKADELGAKNASFTSYTMYCVVALSFDSESNRFKFLLVEDGDGDGKFISKSHSEVVYLD